MDNKKSLFEFYMEIEKMQQEHIKKVEQELQEGDNEDVQRRNDK